MGENLGCQGEFGSQGIEMDRRDRALGCGQRRRSRDPDRVRTGRFNPVSAQTRAGGPPGGGPGHCMGSPTLPQRLANTCNHTLKDFAFWLSSTEWKHFIYD